MEAKEFVRKFVLKFVKEHLDDLKYDIKPEIVNEITDPNYPFEGRPNEDYSMEWIISEVLSREYFEKDGTQVEFVSNDDEDFYYRILKIGTKFIRMTEYYHDSKRRAIYELFRKNQEKLSYWIG